MKLTIVIPYYKRLFLRQALESLAEQSCLDFDVFVGDDCSPENADDIIAEFNERLKITYKRFPQNLGRTSVVAHWNRCISLTTSEWVWLFSDDDLISSDCVARFADELSAGTRRFDLYRFQTSVIDASGAVTRESPLNPPEESAVQIVLARLLDYREFYIQNHIFSRSSFERVKGLVELPTGFFSEDASYSKFALLTGVKTIPQGRVFWRESSVNLNAARPELVDLKLYSFMKHLYLTRGIFRDQNRNFHRSLREGGASWIIRSASSLGGIPTRGAQIIFYLRFFLFAPTKFQRVLTATTQTWARS